MPLAEANQSFVPAIHSDATSRSESFVCPGHPFGCHILLTSRTSGTTLSMVMLVIGAACGICMLGVVCVAEPAMPSITALTICTRSPASTYCGDTPVGIVDGCASDLSCCSAATGGTPSVWLGLRPSPATAASPYKVSGGIIGAWDAVSSKGSSSCQPWAPWFPPLLSKEGGSVRVPCRVRTILKFTTATQLSVIPRIQTRCSDTNCNNPAFQAQNNSNFFYIYINIYLTPMVPEISEPDPSHHQKTIHTINISFKSESYVNT
jgi:hypothetical protein